MFFSVCCGRFYERPAAIVAQMELVCAALQTTAVRKIQVRLTDKGLVVIGERPQVAGISFRWCRHWRHCAPHADCRWLIPPCRSKRPTPGLARQNPRVV